MLNIFFSTNIYRIFNFDKTQKECIFLTTCKKCFSSHDKIQKMMSFCERCCVFSNKCAKIVPLIYMGSNCFQSFGVLTWATHLFSQKKRILKKIKTRKDEIHDKQQLLAKIIDQWGIEQQKRSGGSQKNAKLVETLSLVVVVLLEVYLFLRNHQLCWLGGFRLILFSPNRKRKSLTGWATYLESRTSG